MKKETRIPTIVGLLFLIICLAGAVYVTQLRTIFSPKASSDCQPVNPQVTNITYNTADISFTTPSACTASVAVNSQTFTDLKESSRIHYFQTKGLKATTTYSFSIITGGQTITNSAYSFRTATKPSSALPTSNLAWGKVFAADVKTPASAIVYLNIPGAAPLSSFVTTNGNWSVSLANSYNDTKTTWFTPPPAATSEEIVVISDDGLTTQIDHTTGLNNPVPDIIVGQNYLNLPNISPTVASGQVATVSPIALQKNLTIDNPKEGETISTSLPDFFGSAPLNTRIIFEVTAPSSQTGNTTSNSAGSWHWSPSSPLASGAQTLIAKIQNQTTGEWNTINRKFTVLIASSSGSSLSYVASGSATPTEEPTPTIVPTVRVAHPSTTSPPPVTGEIGPTVITITIALIFFLISIKFIQ